ncbi:uncharacterized protein LOC132562647 [Ylistrum balloti]|uniref:uncharacterized protein LOC132562647 n=1 Tax=Ylistrum balloti TaxID=509963 RepID=UPI00290599E7|nr:uncharacterized protein LOC132562647 [Ylistrum balloti]
MTTSLEFGKVLLNMEEYSDAEWKLVEPLNTGIRLGNFVWKIPRHFLIRLVPLLEKYRYSTTNENLTEFLENNDNREFSFLTDNEEKPLPSTLLNETKSISARSNSALTADVSGNKAINIPTRTLTVTWIKKADMERDLESWKLNMKSGYIKGKKKNRCIPCIINKIVEANKPNDDTDGMATLVKRRRIEGSAKIGSLSELGIDSADSLPIAPEVEAHSETKEESKACVVGPVLYKILPLEVDWNGSITLNEENTTGFLEERIEADGWNFSSIREEEEQTLESNIQDIENELGQLIADQPAVATAFKSLTDEDITRLYHLFEKVEESSEDVDLHDDMSSSVRDILLFAKFHQESGKLKLKEKSESFGWCYYLTVILAETPPTIRKLIERSSGDIFTLLKRVLIETDNLDKIVINADILKCEAAMDVLEKLDIVITGSSIERIPTTLEQVANSVWIALLYRAPTQAVQH